MAKVRLRATQGSSEANHSMSFGKPYSVGLDGYVEVDEEAVEALVEKGGFIREPAPRIAEPEGMVRVRHRHDKDATCSHDGMEFAQEKDGTLLVPSTAVQHLAAHGFMPVVAPDPAPKAEPAPKADEKPTPKAEAPTKADKAADEKAAGK